MDIVDIERCSFCDECGGVFKNSALTEFPYEVNCGPSPKRCKRCQTEVK